VQYKHCPCCKLDKSLELFGFSKSRKDLKTVYCKSCTSKKGKEQYYKNHEYQKNRRKQYIKDNPDIYRKACKKWNSKNKARRSFLKLRQRYRKKLASPMWLTKEDFKQMDTFYMLAKNLETNTNKIYHVDHIIPIKGTEVCGLHVPWNLQVLPAVENLRKGNRFV
jgi:5-methylcytosine-specific restriction endonuclease McrA